MHEKTQFHLCASTVSDDGITKRGRAEAGSVFWRRSEEEGGGWKGRQQHEQGKTAARQHPKQKQDSETANSETGGQRSKLKRRASTPKQPNQNRHTTQELNNYNNNKLGTTTTTATDEINNSERRDVRNSTIQCHQPNAKQTMAQQPRKTSKPQRKEKEEQTWKEQQSRAMEQPDLRTSSLPQLPTPTPAQHRNLRTTQANNQYTQINLFIQQTHNKQPLKKTLIRCKKKYTTTENTRKLSSERANKKDEEQVEINGDTKNETTETKKGETNKTKYRDNKKVDKNTKIAMTKKTKTVENRTKEGEEQTNKEQKRNTINKMRSLRSSHKLRKGWKIRSKGKGTQHKDQPKCAFPPPKSTMTNLYTIEILHADLSNHTYGDTNNLSKSAARIHAALIEVEATATTTAHREYTTLLCEKNDAKKIIYSIPFAQRIRPTNPHTVVVLGLTHQDLSNYSRPTIEDELCEYIYMRHKEEVVDVHVVSKARTPTAYIICQSEAQYRRLLDDPMYCNIPNLPNINVQLRNPATDLSTSKEDLKTCGTWFRPEKPPMRAEDYMPTTSCGVVSIFICNDRVLLLHRSTIQASAMNGVTSQTTNKGPQKHRAMGFMVKGVYEEHKDCEECGEHHETEECALFQDRVEGLCHRAQGMNYNLSKKESDLAFFKIAADEGKKMGTWIKNRNEYDVLTSRGMKGRVPELREYQRLWDCGHSAPILQPTNNYHNPPTTNTAPGAMTIARYQPRQRTPEATGQPQATQPNRSSGSGNTETLLQTILARLQPLETLSSQATALGNLTNTLSSKITNMESRIQNLDHRVEAMAGTNKRNTNSGYQSQDEMEHRPHKKTASRTDHSDVTSNNRRNHDPI
ncbi:hypothetical protein BCR33DRAFT_832363 [Rhizoclosmatium globosum]|uniref:Uncharacterized protein n=1 Tax=Rhizoclosmatium globosum TaxID=329046 RepID=A0A1Y2BUM4_9FUNG|nr:hypothetical protein BCR33DRAFT_832363 [Rhizoclosmatium globosum]|eukprot:ORY38460.1 hypothetical protein BCR33DRAFT_832363 [Rhizoclosmatium globosum]